MNLQRKLIFLISSFCSITIQIACTTTESTPEGIARAPQQVVDEVEDIEAKYEKSFQAAMTAEGDTENEKDHLRAAQVETYFTRQFKFFLITQDLVQGFDQQLDQLYQKKNKNMKFDVGLKTLQDDKVILNIAWEFNDRYLHETQYVFSRLLQESNTPHSPLERAANESLRKINILFDKAWKNGDQLAVLSMVQDLNEVFEDFQERVPKATRPDLFKYLKISDQERTAIYKKGMKNSQPREKTKVELLVEKNWAEYRESRRSEEKETAQGIQPESDTLQPDSGAAGNITGHHFPQGAWALTVDDGPHPTYTMQMIHVLQDAKLPATFFWLSQNLKIYPTLVKAAGDAGFGRASHSYSHVNLPKLGEEGLKHEIDEASDVFTQIVGVRPAFFRCPYGACSGNGSSIRQKIATQKMMHVSWNVETLDWQDKNPQSIFARTKKQMELLQHGIVLMHDTHSQSIEAMKLVAAYIKSQTNWHAYTMDEIYKLEAGRESHSR
jgi:peptidoglycan/xylan/chitin deacetylase (PgdA/CDA1 family)